MATVLEDGVAQVASKAGDKLVFIDRDGRTLLGMPLALADVEF